MAVRELRDQLARRDEEIQGLQAQVGHYYPSRAIVVDEGRCQGTMEPAVRGCRTKMLLLSSPSESFESLSRGLQRLPLIRSGVPVRRTCFRELGAKAPTVTGHCGNNIMGSSTRHLPKPKNSAKHSPSSSQSSFTDTPGICRCGADWTTSLDFVRSRIPFNPF